MLSGDGTTNPEQTTQGENAAAAEVEGAIHNNAGKSDGKGQIFQSAMLQPQAMANAGATVP